MKKEYLFHCAGCEKPDKEYIMNDGHPLSQDTYDGPRITEHNWARNDAYGIYTGLYCDKCYKHNYPYKKYRYHDEAYCGERIEPNE
tara:strand:+ start:142 stop:399 length:258 start_codon:yes stop_codon:yes gene_type:complete